MVQVVRYLIRRTSTVSTRNQMRVTVDGSKNTMRERGTLITHNVTGRNIARKQERNHSCAA